MKIFLTGGTGFIGSHFINQAHDAGHQIVALRGEHSRPRVPLKKEPQWVIGKLDGDHAEHLAGCDVLVHLAAHSANPPYDSLANCLYWNVTASLGLFEQAAAVGITRFQVAGSCFEYGRAGERYDFIPVDAPLEPTMTYPTSKAAASIVFQGFAAERRVRLAIYRLFQVYGEGELESRLWPSLRRAALAGEDFPMTLGEQVRDFIDVDAAARVFGEDLSLATVVPGQARIRHVGTGRPQTIRQFAETWWAHWGAGGHLLPGAVPYRANEVMRFVPQID